MSASPLIFVFIKSSFFFFSYYVFAIVWICVEYLKNTNKYQIQEHSEVV